MSIQRTAESALHALEELYNILDLSSQQQGHMTNDDSENLVHALCNLSQLITQMNHTGMCGREQMVTASGNLARRRVRPYSAPDGDMTMMDTATIGPLPAPGQAYGECVLYHPIRIVTTCADGPTVLHENDFSRKEASFRKGHGHSSHSKDKRLVQRGRGSKSAGRSSRVSRSGSRLSRRSRRSSHGGRASQSRGRKSHSSRRQSSSRRSSRARGRSSRSSRHSRRRSSRSRSRSSRSNRSRRSRSSRRSSRGSRRNSRKRRSSDRRNKQLPNQQLPLRLAPTPVNPTAPSSIQQPYIRTLPSPAPISIGGNNGMPTSASFVPNIPLPPPPATSALHHHPPPPPTMPHQFPPSLSMPHGSSPPIYRPVAMSTGEQHSPLQQVPMTSTGSATLYQPPPFSHLNIPVQGGPTSSNVTPLQTTTGTLNAQLTSRSENCPECRAITRLLQWAPLKCYDAAGLRRGIFLAGPKSEQLLKALYSSVKDSSMSFDDIENCLCDNE